MSIINWYFIGGLLCGDICTGKQYQFILKHQWVKVDAYHINYKGQILELHDSTIDGHFKPRLHEYRKMLAA